MPVKCKICGSIPVGPFNVNLANKGCTVKAYCIECSHENSEDDWLQHSIAIYGDTQDLAIDRWNEINR